MDIRTKLPLLFFVLATLLLSPSCGLNQQTKFHMAFLPPAPAVLAAAVVEVSDPPVVPPNLHVKEAPAFLAPPISAPDSMIERADQRFQRGVLAYRAQRYEEARRDFDGAVDLMLEAAEHFPARSEEHTSELLS